MTTRFRENPKDLAGACSYYCSVINYQQIAHLHSQCWH
jgi:hypothetical protein